MDVAASALEEFAVSHGFSLAAKESVRQAIDIVDLVSSYVQLRRQGRLYVGLCPWHDDTRPSLQVNPQRQSFKCWVCDIGGDIFSFVMKIEGVGFPEALAMLAERAGIALKPADAIGWSDAGQGKPTLYKAMAWACRQYHQCLLNSPDAEPARRYLQQRGITSESIVKFQLGFCPPQRDWILRKFPADEARAAILEKIGILVKTDDRRDRYDRFRGRLLFTIRDVEGRPVGIGGRVLPELSAGSPAKYVNSPETQLFSKSSLLYGLDLAKDSIRRARRAIVVEGYTDVIVAHQYGFTETVAVLGTALGENHIRLLKRFADQVVLLLDGDEAGQRRANEVLELFVAHQVDLKILTLPAGLDPCDFLQQHGAPALHKLLEAQAIDALEHAFRAKTRGVDLDRDVHRASQALEELIGIVAKAPRLREDTASAFRLREQKALQRLAMMFRVDEADIRQRLIALRRKPLQPPVRGRLARQTTATTRDVTPEQAKPDAWQRELLELLVAHPQQFTRFAAQISAAWLGSGLGRAVYDAACRLAAEGLTPDFDRLMLHLDDPAVKNLLVELDERAAAKGLHAVEPAALIEALIQRFRHKETQQRRPAELVALRNKQLDEDQTLALLERIRQQEQDRQGISELSEE